MQNKIYFMTDIAKAFHLSVSYFPLDMVLTPIRPDTPHQIMVPTIKPGTALSNQTLYPMDLVTFHLLDMVLPLDLVLPIGIRMTAPSHEVVILTSGHWRRSTYFSN